MTLYICDENESNIYHPFGEMTICLMISLLKTSLAIEKYFYELFKIKNLEIDIRCHKFMEKDFLDYHMDGYAGGYALTVSLNKRWKWDWGGILNILHGKDESSILGLLPKWRLLIF